MTYIFNLSKHFNSLENIFVTSFFFFFFNKIVDINYRKKCFYTKENKRNNFPKNLGSIYLL